MFSEVCQRELYFSELGILIDNNKTVSWIKPGSVADLEERLTVGDKIINVRFFKQLRRLASVGSGYNNINKEQKFYSLSKRYNKIEDCIV